MCMNITREDFQKKLEAQFCFQMETSPSQASDEQFYKACALTVRSYLEEKRRIFVADTVNKGRKRVHYLSMEFLLGKNLRNALFNLQLTNVARSVLAGYGVKLDNLFQYEPDPGLGNGGLGRLAACYLDALATQSLPAGGHCILYEYGIFRQKLGAEGQSELPDYWLPGGDVWLDIVPEQAVSVRFGGNLSETWDGHYHDVDYHDSETVLAVPYNLYIPGYNSDGVSVLRLWQAKSPGIDMEKFNNGDYLGAFGHNTLSETISKVLYPNDNHFEGKQLRLRQQYFLAAAAMSDIIRQHMLTYSTLENFAEQNAVHINDTHPTLAIAELMRLLLDECGYNWDSAWALVTKTFAYTNHTVMSEALECWDVGLFRQLLPRIYQIIVEIDERFTSALAKEGVDPEEIARLAIFQNGYIRMANLCVIASHKVNGVSKLHSQIIKDQLFHGYYKLTPDKFTNVTNGIASRRWLLQSNPGLADLITQLIGEEYKTDFAQIGKLGAFADRHDVLEALAKVKARNKESFANFLKEKTGVSINPFSIFDVQVKRLHEYKRQHMNALHILSSYLYLKNNPGAPFAPKTYIFGAKAAPGYVLAKEIIRFILALGRMIDNDPAVAEKLKVVFLEEYNVTLSEWLMPASEISEQISLASTEASGTGNMKLMLNGAITLGTMDGANVEIADAAGQENMFIFGMRADEVKARQPHYNPGEVYAQDPVVREAVDFLAHCPAFQDFGTVLSCFQKTDYYMALADFAAYREAQAKASALYHNVYDWQRMSLCNIAGSGIFCADRAVGDYARDIWHL